MVLKCLTGFRHVSQSLRKLSFKVIQKNKKKVSRRFHTKVEKYGSNTITVTALTGGGQWVHKYQIRVSG